MECWALVGMVVIVILVAAEGVLVRSRFVHAIPAGSSRETRSVGHVSVNAADRRVFGTDWPSVAGGLDAARSEAVGDSVIMVVYGIFVVENIIGRVARLVAMVGHGLRESIEWWAVVGTRSSGRSSGAQDLGLGEGEGSKTSAFGRRDGWGERKYGRRRICHEFRVASVG
jgi:hypothetical protein